MAHFRGGPLDGRREVITDQVFRSGVYTIDLFQEGQMMHGQYRCVTVGTFGKNEQWWEWNHAALRPATVVEEHS